MTHHKAYLAWHYVHAVLCTVGTLYKLLYIINLGFINALLLVRLDCFSRVLSTL